MGFHRCLIQAATVASTTWHQTTTMRLKSTPIVGDYVTMHLGGTLMRHLGVHRRTFSTSMASNNQSLNDGDDIPSTGPSPIKPALSLVQHEIARYDPSIPIHRAHTPPSSWYTSPDILDLERRLVFLERNWVAVDILRATKPGSFQTGIFNNQPYLITNNADGELKAFYNVCTHAGSCLVGPWTNNPTTAFRLATSESRLVGQPLQQQQRNQNQNQRTQHYHHGELDEKQQRRGMQCPYHGWQFNLDGKLIKTTQMKGIEDFRNKNYDLRSIEMKVVGPIVYMKFQKLGTDGSP